jgi:hypothetical protein
MASDWDSISTPAAPQQDASSAWDAISTPAAAAKPDIGRGAAAMAGIRAGVAANFNDELKGGEAAGAPLYIMGMPVGAMAGMANAGIDALRGGGPALDAYTKARDAERQTMATAQEQHPGYTLGGELGGVAASIPATPVVRAVEGVRLAGRALNAALTGGLYGAISGAGEGQGATDTAARAATGGVLGTAVGGVAAPAVEGVIQGGRALTQPIVSAMRGAINPDAEAARRVVGSIQRDIVADPAAETRLTPQEFAASVQSGGPATVMDIGGGLTRRLADVAGITSPEGGAAMNRAIDERFEGQSGRITDWLRRTFNYPNAQAQQDAIQQTARTVNGPAYRAAYGAGDREIWSPELERLTAAPYVQGALQDAVSKWKNYAVRDGFGAANPPFRVENGGLIRTGGGMQAYPNIQLWDYAARELQDKAREAAPGTQQKALYNDLARALKNELDTIAPEYRAAREGAAGFFGAENALEAGQNFVGAGKSLGIDESRAAIGRMSPQERQLFQDGYVSQLVDKLNAAPDRRNVLNMIAESPAAREELRIAVGPQRAAELEAGLRVEGIMDLARNATQGNSWTTRRLYDLGLATGTGIGGVGTYNMDPKEAASGALIAALSSGGKRIDARVMQRVAEMLVSNDPQVLTRGMQIVARQGNLMQALRATDRRIAAAGAENVPTGLAVQAPGAGRADDQKQQRIPGPPAQ